MVHNFETVLQILRSIYLRFLFEQNVRETEA